MSLLAQDERLARRVGAITLAVIAAAIVFVVFVWDQIEWGAKTRITVYMRGTGGLKEGAPLIVAGREVGVIESIQRAPHGATNPLAGEEGVAIRIAIDRDDARGLTKGADVFVASRGILSARYLELGPMPETGPALADGDELVGREPPRLDRVLQRTWDNLMTVKGFIEAVRPEVDALRVRIAELETSLGQVSPVVAGAPVLALEVEALIAEARQTYAGLGGADGLARIDAVLTRARTTLATMRSSIADLRTRADVLLAATSALRARAGERGSQALASLELAITRAQDAFAKIDPLLAKIDDVRTRIERGEGSIGRLMKDPEFPEDAKELGKILKRQPWRVIARPKD